MDKPGAANMTRIQVLLPAWTEQEWNDIQFFARIARKPEPAPPFRPTAQGAQRGASARLREVALQTEIGQARQAPFVSKERRHG